MTRAIKRGYVDDPSTASDYSIGKIKYYLFCGEI